MTRSTAIDFTTGAPTPVDLDSTTWIHGTPAGRPVTDPPIQVHRPDPHTFILRQSMSVHHEAPFLYLLCGNDRALLLDSGATADSGEFPLRRTVDELLATWLSEHPRDSYPLVVAHTHAHGDHVAADAQFTNRPDTVVVGHGVPEVAAHFGLADWPTDVVGYDLGGRVLEVLACPGHHETSIAVFDRWTGFLLTGDTVLRGRLMINDREAFVASIDRLLRLAGTRTVTHVLGGHVEMAARGPGRDFPLGALHQPGEVPLPMSVAHLHAIRDAMDAVGTRPGAHRFDDFVVFNPPWQRALPRYVLRSGWHRLTRQAARLTTRLRPRLTAPPA